MYVVRWNAIVMHVEQCMYSRRNYFSHFPTFYDLHSKLWSIIRTRGHVFDFAQSQYPVDDFAEHDVFVVQEITFRRGDEELTTIRIWSRICH